MTMNELTQADFDKIRPLFAPLAHHLTIDAILSGLTPGQVWVDDVAAPQTAVCWYGHRLYLSGRADDPATRRACARLLADMYVPDAQARGKAAYIAHGSLAWRAYMPQVLAAWEPTQYGRLYYRLDARGRDWTPRLPEGYTLRPVDAALLADATLTNREWVTEEMVSERPSIADFLAKSFGWCVQHGERIVAWCMSEYNTGHRCELGIATDEAQQRKGLATGVGTAVIRHALAQNVYDIGWDCWANNLPSIATAEKLGLRRVAETAVWFGFWPR